MTLYCGYREQYGTNKDFLSTTKVIKIENVYKIAKPLSILSKAKNNNLYALIGENLEVLSLGMLKELKSKEGKTIYVGQKVFTTEKKILCDYYRQKAQEFRKRLHDSIKLTNILYDQSSESSLMAFYKGQIERYKLRIQDTEKSYKEVIENIKQL